MTVWWCEDCQEATPSISAIHRINHWNALTEMQLVPIDAIVSEEERRVWELANRGPEE